MSARVNWAFITPSNARTYYMFFAVIAAESPSFVRGARWIQNVPPMTTSMCAAIATARDLHRK